jgi:tripartite-type tricarboxylate transporter receptor subunit TctC
MRAIRCLREWFAGRAFAAACRAGGAILLAGGLPASALAGEAYPNRPIKIVSAVGPGGGPDLVARVLAEQLSILLKQPVLVENKAGANGNIAMEYVWRAAPDGYTLLVAPDATIAGSRHLYKKLPFNPQELVPLASLVSNSMVLTVNPRVPVGNVTELVEYAKTANPSLTYASGGLGSQHHITMERLIARSGLKILHVPYKSGAPATFAAVAGEVDAVFGGSSNSQQIKAGKLKALGVTTLTRSALYPEVPAIAEAYPGFEMRQWYGLFAPPNLPAELARQINEASNEVLRNPAVIEKLHNIGGNQAWAQSREQFVDFVKSEDERYGADIKSMNLSLD